MKIIQISNAISAYDAISSQILAIAETAKRHGYENEILVKWKDDTLNHKSIIRLEGQNEISNLSNSTDDDIIIFHHYTKSLLIDFLKKMHGRKILYYHNITPPHFFRKYDPKFANEQQNGLEQLQVLKSLCTISAGSKYNVLELKKLGFTKVYEIPYYLDMKQYLKKKSTKFKQS